MKRTVALVTILLLVSAFAPAATAAGTDSLTFKQSDGSSVADATCEFPSTHTDATGEQITLEEAPDSVVALQPSDAQTMFEIGAEGQLDGMPDNPATEDLEMGDRTAISDGYEIQSELVVGVEPDLVLAANITSSGTIDELRTAGLDVYVFGEGNSIDDVQENVLTTGELVGECNGANNSVEWMDERIDLLESATEDDDNDRPLAFYDMQGGYSAGANSFQNDVLTTAGLENLAERVGVGAWGSVSSEEIVTEDPDWVIHSDNVDGEFEFSSGVTETTAYAEDNVAAVDGNAMSQPAPQVVFAIEEIVQAVYPDAYAEIEADLEALDDEYRVDSNEQPDSGDNDPVSGFVAPTAAATLIATAVLILRRR